MSALNCTADLQEIFAEQEPVSSYTTHSVLVTWLFFNVASSHLFLPLLVAALSFAKPKVEPTVINLVLTWIIYGLVSSILLYANHTEGCEPPPILCLTQASLYIALPPMTTVALMNAVLQNFFNVREKIHDSFEPKDHAIRRVIFLVSPYCIYAIFATTVAASGASSSSFFSSVSRTRRFFYCSVRSAFLTNTVIGFCAIVLLVILGFSIWTGILLHQNWHKLHRPMKNRLDFGGIFRIFGFSVYTLVALSLALVHHQALVVSDMAMATMGFVIIFVFGSQKSVLQACSTSLNCFYLRNAKVTRKAVEKMRMVV